MKKIIIGVLIVLAALWLYGFARGMIDAHKGVSLLTISMRYDGLNPISAHGYKTYIGNFTGAPQAAGSIVRDIENFMKRY